MSRQYPIWVEIKSCLYQDAKSYGIKDHGIQKIKIGTSSKNSTNFCTVEIKRTLQDNIWYFKYFFDGKLLKEATFTNQNDKPKDHIETKSYL